MWSADASYMLHEQDHDDDLFLSLLNSTSPKALQRRRAVVFASLLLLSGLICLDLSTDESLLVRHTTSSMAYLRQVDVLTTPPPETCRVQFVVDGDTYVPKSFPTLPAWIRQSDASCAIEYIRSDHAFVDELPPAQKAMFDDTAFLTIVQADFMKLLIVYYLGGLVADLDVEPLKRFPSEWTGPTTALATCDVVLGIEVNCFDDVCARTMVRKGQIQNWAMYARRPHSRFIGALLDYVVAKYSTFLPPHDRNVSVQEVAGSGTITDFVNQYGGFGPWRQHYQAETSPGGGTLQTNLSSVLRIKKDDEEVCVVGPNWTGGSCGGSQPLCLLHHSYAGTWRHA
ncbi:Aste57867_12685 [Aphanomyces stellatus]|uniref:Aste57867_12685 protein n=1 Tax=Aphanomyces stellatus TaxID=120398 RepID=A0A485KWN2_9STRA|nr:hypothetical protein As57867_012638 [Aphanomyces stellatus]VFT89535.1 Aste57867_12685 [Aphanomyces stellatus]